MSVSPHEGLVRDYLEAVFNRHELDHLDVYWVQDLASHWLGQESLHGLAAWRAAMSDFFAAFPDLSYTLDDLFFDGDRGEYDRLGLYRQLGAIPLDD
jgi:predicted ester cyclase